jgi:hypothetical protein
MAASLFVGGKGRSVAQTIPKRSTVVALFIAVRLVIVPVLGVGLVLLAKSTAPWLIGDTITTLIIILQFGCTSSQSAIVVCQAYGSQQTAGMLAYVYLFQHLFAAFTLTALATIALGVSL